MENGTIILVGNGPSLWDSENGKRIDAFDFVVRFNNFDIQLSPQHTGEKVDIWFLVSNVRIRSYPCREVYFHTWERDKVAHKHFVKVKELYPDAQCVGESDISEMREQFKSDRPYHMPSTGLIAAYLMLKRFPRVYLTGFDWWRENDYQTHHYFDARSPRFEETGSGHRPSIEKHYLDRWSDRVCFL